MGNFCCCKELPKTTKGPDIFNILSSYLESCGLSWNQCVGICTDGTPSVIGSIKGFVTLAKEKNYENYNRKVPVSKTIRENIKQVLDVALNVVNFIKQGPLKSRIFAKLGESMQKDQYSLFRHTEVRCLSREKVL
jgi:hypothetical protein